jgi:hypothetical protein
MVMNIDSMLAVAPSHEDVDQRFPPPLLPYAIRIGIDGPEQASSVVQKLFSLGFGFFDGIKLATDISLPGDVCGFTASRRGHLSVYYGCVDKMGFDLDRSRPLIDVAVLLSARSLDDLVHGCPALKMPPD